MIDDIAEMMPYGHVIHRKALLKLLGVVITDDADLIGTSPAHIRSVAKHEEFAELSAVTPLRFALLAKGRYLKKDGEAYRVLLPSENTAVAANMLDTANGKIKRANLLLRNTPVQPQDKTNSLSRAAIAQARLKGKPFGCNKLVVAVINAMCCSQDQPVFDQGRGAKPFSRDIKTAHSFPAAPVLAGVHGDNGVLLSLGSIRP